MKRNLLLGVLLLMVACSKKDDTNTPTNPTPTTDTTRADANKLTASPWQGVGMYNLYYNLGTNALTGGDGANIHMPGQYAMFWIDSFKAKFTFAANNTFNHVRWDGRGDTDCYTVFIPTNGSWQLTDDNKTVKMSFPSAPGGMISYHVVSFKDNYMHLTYTDTVGAQKDVFNLEFQR